MLPILQVGDVLLSPDILTEHFCCDLEACGGACCIEGEAGAPITPAEVKELERVLPAVWMELDPKARKVLNKQGVAYRDEDGDLVTSIVNGKDCCFTCYDKNGICLCATDPHTLIFFESPKRVHETLTLMAEVFGAEREAALCRELTKTYEEVIRGSLAELIEATEGEVLGEITLVVAPGRAQGNADDHVEAVLALAAEGMRLKDAAAEVAEATGLRKNELYRAALARTN